MQALLYDLLARSAPDVGVFADSDECSAAAGVALLQRKTPFVLPDFRAQKGDDLRAYHDELLELLAVLRAYHRAQGNKILIAPFHTLLYPLPSPAILQGFEIAKSQNIAPRALADKLVCFGYVHVDMIELSGEMSLRGDILDIYPPTLEPLRIEFFGDEIESIRPFDTTSQLSHKNEHTSLEIPPVLFALSPESYESLAESVRESPYTSFHKDIQSLGLWHLPASMCAAIALKNACVSAKAHEAIGEELELFEPNSEEHARLSRMHALAPLAPKEGFVDFTLSLSSLPTFLQIHSNKHITIIARNDVLLRQYNIDSEQYTICKESFCVQFMTPTELFLSLNAPIAQKKPKHKTRIVLDEIAVGDYIVHRDYGIGIFQGISQEKVLGALRDFILLQYQGEDRLLLPVENLDMIDRYIADSGSVPIVDTLGNKKFARLKEKVRTELLKIAQNIIDLAAKRTLTQGMVFDVAAPELALFQAQSGFSYTDDQQSAIAEIFADLSSGNVMDRLLSGDVGFGKTEVAMNAIFVAHKSGAQSALLVPTTLLALQHTQTLSERLAPFGLRVAKLDRFVVGKEKTALLSALKEGRIDVLIGTHALLDIEFRNLGLIIVDEEHKFGVKQKEKIKTLSSNLHMLSMSATPIPRTLNLALSEIKSLSTLTTPPSQRIPVRTFLKEYSNALVKEAIMREIRRGGQVFYIHNNIATMPHVYEHLTSLLPNLKIAILHSQIPPKDSENIMLDFAKGAYQLLLCTSIVESGLHLPNANTILIESSDRFGIADLHQLRGRVGRGRVEGFCYFFYESQQKLTEQSQKRLLALSAHSELGSGAILAYHDLEIRGGGNILGEAQSGHIKNIGYSLYLRMLEDTIYSLSQKGSAEKGDVDMNLSVNAFISPEYITSERLRLNLYRRLSLCEESAHVTNIELEINDRFGKPDNFTQQFLSLIHIKILAKQLQITKIINYNQKITIFEGETRHSFDANSRDDDDLLHALLGYLHKRQKETLCA